MKVVLDTNVWISGLMFPASQAGKILSLWKASQLTIVTSPAILHELKTVLLYPKIRKRILWDENKVEQYVGTLKFLTDFIVPDDSISLAIVPRDVNDIAILSTFLASDAKFLVTGDEDLLVIRNHYAIITVAEFCQLI